jgi:hypothetical protein
MVSKREPVWCDWYAMGAMVGIGRFGDYRDWVIGGIVLMRTQRL